MVAENSSNVINNAPNKENERKNNNKKNMRTSLTFAAYFPPERFRISNKTFFPSLAGIINI